VPCPQGTNSKLAGAPSHYPYNAERQAGKLWNTNFLSLLIWLGQNIEPKSTDYETDALTTRRPRAGLPFRRR